MRGVVAALAGAAVLFASAVYAGEETTRPADDSGGSCKVVKMVFCTGIDKREATGVATEFPASVGKVYCWSRIAISQAPFTLKHVWYRDGGKVLEVPLTLQSAGGRLWSAKNVSAGEWKVEVQTEGGEVVETGTFTVK